MYSMESYVYRCLLKSRGEPLFTVKQRAGDNAFDTLATLDGYAIVPLEEYYALIGEPCPLHTLPPLHRWNKEQP